MHTHARVSMLQEVGLPGPPLPGWVRSRANVLLSVRTRNVHGRAHTNHRVGQPCEPKYSPMCPHTQLASATALCQQYGEQVHAVQANGFPELFAPAAFAAVHILSLSQCKQITDVSALGK